jgi:phosphate transport system permease protein
LSRFQNDFILTSVLKFIAVLVGFIVVFIFIFIFKESYPIIRDIGLVRFFTDSGWYPREGLYGLMPMVWATLFSTLLSVFIATPIAVLSAIFSHFYAPPFLRTFLRILIELLAGIPSVVFGFWGLVVLVPLINQTHPPGASLLAAVFILTIMILPTIALLADSSLSNIPVQYLRGASALGLSRWSTIKGIVLPTAKSGIFTGIILGAGRALGETMAVLMVAGNVVQIPKSLFDPVRTLTANIALEMAYALDNHRAALFVSGLILLFIITLLVIITESFGHEKIYE